MTEFRPMQKIPRLSREIIVTEKIDGTNASVHIIAGDAYEEGALASVLHPTEGVLHIRASSRTRWITPDGDNHGFARWVYDHVEELKALGPGHHFGEWWGGSIQRGYGLQEKRFSLFNVGRWKDPSVPGQMPIPEDGESWCPPCCYVVPAVLLCGARTVPRAF